ncbi:MAG: acyl-ACP--UDP-N-acetylglucosamine O-acyltransferase [Fimbriimonadaceae bacterium]|nr:acyl-ACP--UDP-N-acetylglucosamine O-acyltransferase [Alphaproteobacteria bacterium]
MAEIHATAFVSDGAVLGDDVRIGPYCVIGENVTIGAGTILRSHIVVEGRTEIGAECQIFPFSSLGHAPQDVQYRGEDTSLVIGSRNIIREYVSMNRGTVNGKSQTVVGDDCMFMASSHVAHDCVIGNQVVFANNATLAGHCQVGDFAILGGLCAAHQRVRIGRYAFVGGLAGIENDVIPYGSVLGNRAYLGGLNIIGLKRRGIGREAIHNLRRAYRVLFGGEGTLVERVEQVAESYPDDSAVQEIVAFIRAESARALCVPRHVRSV